MPCNRILFVGTQGDNAELLEQTLPQLTTEWTADFVSDTPAALQALKNGTYSIAISDVVSAADEGIEFLKGVSESHPGTVRFILSEQADKELILKTSGFVHQCIKTPIDPTTLAKLLRNSLGLRKLLRAPELHSKIAMIESLPSPPKIYSELVSELQSENCSMQKIADLIGQDIAITAKMLKIVNSTFFGLKTHIENPLHAVRLLGLDTVQSLVLAAGVQGQFKCQRIPGFSVESIQTNSLAVGTSARSLSSSLGLEKQQIEDSLLAGMLHNVGALVMLAYMPDELKESIVLAERKSITLPEAEQVLMKVNHAEIGAHLLSLWGLPDSIVEAVALHCSPHKAPIPMLNVLTSVHLAYGLHEEQIESENEVERESVLDKKYLTDLGLTQNLPYLQRLCMVETC